MVAYSDRVAEERRLKLEKIKQQIKAGSLTVRAMTEDERRRYPPLPPKVRRK
jgi:hypothetical protein